MLASRLLARIKHPNRLRGRTAIRHAGQQRPQLRQFGGRQIRLNVRAQNGGERCHRRFGGTTTLGALPALVLLQLGQPGQLGSNRPSPEHGILVVRVFFFFELVDGIG